MFELNFDELKFWHEMKKILFVSAAALLMWACSSEETAPVEEETIEEGVEATTTGRISIFPVFTKVSDETFEDGDQIGVTITTSSGTVHATNACLTYSASDGTFTGDVTWYDGSETCTIVAYYPYQSDNVSSSGYPSSFSVATDQTDGTSSSDLVVGTAEGVSPSSDAVSIDFYHLLSRINVKVSTGTKISSIKLSGSTIDCSVSGSTVSKSSTTGEITLYPATADTLYQAILVPQTVTLTLSLTTSGGTTVTKSLSSKTLAGGTEYDLNVSYPYINGYKYVDLGLSSGLLWATYNVGASSETGTGTYVAWGSITTQSSWTLSDANSIYKDTSVSDISGNSSYDLARNKWKTPWRMPTYKEFKNLIDSCTLEDDEVDDVSGILVTGTNGNTIFFPYSGYMFNSALQNSAYCYYWSSTAQGSNGNKAYYYSSSDGAMMYTLFRYVGMVVRPVADAGVYDD